MVFPIHSFLSPTSPFPTRWLPRLVRHFSCGTMRMLRLPSARPLALGFLRTTVTSLTPFLSLASGSWSCSRCAWALVYRSRHMLRFFLQEEASRISQVPRVPFRAFALLSDPGRISTPSLLRRFDSAPAVQTTKAPTSGHYFEAQSHGLAPAPYASCRHRCQLRNVRFRLVASLCRVGFFTHWVPVLCFRVLFSIRLHALPHILGLLDATATPELLILLV